MKGLKQLIKQSMAKRGYDVHRVPRPLLEMPRSRLRISYELLVPSLFPNPRDVCFVQIGANDGVRADPIHKMVIKHAWRGILVEPQPDMFDSLKKTYANCPGLVFVNAAVSQEDGQRPLYRVEPAPDLPAYANGLASFSMDILLRHRRWIPDIQRRIQTIPVSCVTFAGLLQRGRLDRIDVLQIDVEGFDAEIIRMVNFSTINPKIICYEWKHLSCSDHDSTARRLIDNGYHLAQADTDMFAVKNDGLA